MKTNLLRIALALMCSAGLATAAPLGTAFTYQGKLTDGANPANGVYDLQFNLFSVAVGGSALTGPVVADDLSITNGLFTVTLDFGAAFDGSARWLEIGVRTNGGGAFLPLTPRQGLTATPYALYAPSAGTLSGTSLITGAVTFNPASGPPFAVGRTNQVTNLNADLLDGLDSTRFWRLGGNGGTTTNDFIGTTDNQPLEFKVNGQRTLRLEAETYDGTANMIGGSPGNFVRDGVRGATIGGGGDTSPDSGAKTNCVLSSFGTISGGRSNTVGSAADGATIGGGNANVINMSSTEATIAGGSGNCIGGSSYAATIAGGKGNRIDVSSDHSSIGGGSANTIAHGSPYGSIAGGLVNTIGPNSAYCVIAGGMKNNIRSNLNCVTIAGGFENSVGANSSCSTIGGGQDNTIASNASYATIPGGYSNFVTNYAFAAGTSAKARHVGAFVWGDSWWIADIASTNADSVTMRASGGYRLFSNSGATTGVYLAPGGGSWTTMSDRSAKENFDAVDAQAVLAKVAALPLTTWNYKSQAAGIRHLGPMAQDFKAAFGVGESDTGITTIDADGVALAAIQGLNQKLEQKESEIAELKTRLGRLEQRFNVRNGGVK